MKKTAIRTEDTSYVECYRTIPEGHIECAERPSEDHVPADTWQTNPMDPSVCWRLKTPAEQDAELDEVADIEQQFDNTLKAFALVVLDEINGLRQKAGLQPRTVAQLKQAVKSKL
jgi:hypothetical protein